MQLLTETRSLPRWWKSKTELQVLNADNKPPNARQMNLQGKQTAPGGEEAIVAKTSKRHKEEECTGCVNSGVLSVQVLYFK